MSETKYEIYGNNLMSAQVLEVPPLGRGTVRKGCVVNGRTNKAMNKRVRLPPVHALFHLEQSTEGSNCDQITIN